jgi:5-methylcytosine-specific restriction endonuclease McrA
MRICIECSKEHSDMRRRICGTCRVRRARRTVKLKAVEYMGGKCSYCGYSKSLRALEFHHLDPTQKDFQISKASNPSWENVKEELKKCVMLCSNCHAEEHEKIAD